MSLPFLAVDVGGSRVKAAVVRDGDASELPPEPVAAGLDGIVRQLAGLYRRAAGGRELGWGLCVPGLLDPERGLVRYAANLGLRDAPLVARLPAGVPAPRVFVNDLVAAAAGEAGGGTLALVQVGTGVAARYVLSGAVLPGASGYAGELGHLRFRPGGRQCTCGRQGCVEAYGGWGGIRRRYDEAGRSAREPVDLLAAAREDEWAARVLADALDAVGFAVSALVAACDPGTVRLGGGLAAAFADVLVDAVDASLHAHVLPELAAATHVERSTLGDRASLLGLYALASTGREGATGGSPARP